VRAALAATALLASACSPAPRPSVDALAEAEQRLGIELEERIVETNGVRLHVVLAGPSDGPPVVLLHGIPEFWFGWHRQMGALAGAGYRVVVPDQRGYNASDKPEGVEAYRGIDGVNDVVGLIDALGYERVRLAGHDMGGGLSWYLAIEHPERIERMLVFGIGHPDAFRELRADGDVPFTARAFYGTLAVLLRSRATEGLARLDDWALLVQILRRIGAGGAFSDEELPFFRAAWEREDSFHYIMNWYRASFADGPHYTRDTRVLPPTLVAVLEADPLVPQEPARQSARFCADGRVAAMPGASHWVLHEQPEAANALLLDFFGTGG
jgi:pimeloyl-ACP methyl ester carboxylesterase